MYDLVAGIHCLKSSYVLSKTKALELFPMLKKDRLVGAIVYYDGKIFFKAFVYSPVHMFCGILKATLSLFSVNTKKQLSQCCCLFPFFLF